MPNSQKDPVYDKLMEPVKIYLSKETKEMLETDCRNFAITNHNKFYNLLISNYIDEYTTRLEKTGATILNKMYELIVGGNKKDFPVIARKLAFESNSVKDSDEKEAYISIRINSANVTSIAGTIESIADEIKISVFFRNLFLNYLTLPTYRREQIIYAQQYNTIMRAIREKRKISYRHRNKEKKGSRIFNTFSFELSTTEFHNYLIGSFDGKNGASSIKLITIDSVRIINESVSYSDTFKECYKAMKQNGFQFNMSELQYHKIYLTEEALKRYNARYLDRPVIIDEGEDSNGKYYIFNCSLFQLKGYFSPFRPDIEILDYDPNTISNS